MPAAPFLSTIRELVRCYQAFETTSSRQIRSMGMTPAQFDIIVTLGDTEGMTFTELGRRTLITKGTLTGVVDRLAARRLVRRVASPTDGRSQIVQLTPSGDALYRRVFPAQLAHLGRILERVPRAELAQAEAVLRSLRAVFEAAPEAGAAAPPGRSVAGREGRRAAASSR